jgi:group I intron endonuclease
MKQQIEGYNGNYRVYVHINKINNKIYIGQTCQTLERRAGNNGFQYQHSCHFYNAIQKYGWDNFKHLVLIDNISLEMANIIEEKLIFIYNSMNPKYGYNMIAGGKNKERRQEVTDKIAEKNRHPSDETRKKMSIAAKKRKMTPELKEKLRLSNIGKKRSKEAREHMSIAKQNMSEETKRKIVESLKGRKQSERQKMLSSIRFTGNKYRAKAIAQYDLNGKFMRTWECAMDVEKEWGINHLHTNISACCNNKALSAYGYQWKYYYGNNSDIEQKKYTNKIPVEQYSINGIYMNTYESVSDAARKVGTITGDISRCCKGLSKLIHGFQWKYANDNKIIKDLEYKYIDKINGQKYKRKQDIEEQTGLSDSDIMKCLKNNEIVVKNNISYKIQKL